MTVTSNNTCGSASASATYFINVDPLPVASAGGSDIICSNSSATVSGASASNGTILWTENGSGSLINPTTLTPTYIADAADEGNDVILTLIVTSNNTCGTASDTAYYTITVDSLPTATTAGSSTICSDSIFTLPVGAASASNGTILWTENGAGNITAGVNTLTPTYTPASGDEGNVVTLTMTVTSSNTCGTAKATATYSISVETPLTPSVSIAANATEVCDGDNITFTATPVNGGTSPSYNWLVDGSSVGAPDDSTFTTSALSDGQVVTVELISNGTCVSGVATSNSIPVTIVASAPLQPGPIDGLTAICPALSTVYTIDTVAGASDYTWTVPPGWIIESGQGTTSLSVTIPTVGQTGNVTVTANNVCGSSSQEILAVTVASDGSVYAGPDQKVCAGTTQVNLAGQISGAINHKNDWDWTLISGGSLEFKGEDNLNTLYYLPSNTDTIYVEIHSTSSVGGCGFLSDTMMIIVLPDPTASISSLSPVCEGETSPVTFTGTANTTVTYNIDGGSDQTVDIDGTGSVTLTTATITASTTYNLISVEYTDAPACSQPISGSTTITLDPQPTADAGTDQTICADDSVLLAGTITDAVSGTWSGGTGTFNPDNSTLNAYYIPSASEITAGSVTLTLTPSNPASSCDSIPDNVVITIDPLPTVEAGDPDTVCQSGSPDAIILSGATIGGGATTGTWSITSGGGNLSSTAQTATPGTVTYTPEIDFTGTVTLTLTTNASGSCDAVIDTRIIVVEPAPTVVAGSPDTVCQSAIPTPITLSGANVGGGASTGIWSITSGGGTLGHTTPSASPDTVTYTPAVGYNGTVSLTLTTDIVGTCEAVSATRTITIRPAPTVDAGAPQTICADDSVYLAGSVGGSATSGTWSGGAGSFYPDATTLNAAYKPSAAEIVAGSVTLTLTTDDPPGLCDAVSEDVQITIDPTVTVNAGTNDTICQGNSVVLEGTIGGGASTGSWVGGAGTFNPGRSNLNATYTPSAAEVAAGSVLLTLTSADPAGACGPQSDTTRIVIYKAVVITSQPVNTGACVGDSVALTVVATGSQLSYQWYIDGSPVGTNSPDLQIDPVSLADDASYYVEITGSPYCSPVTSNTVTLNVDAAITISSQPASQTECEGADVIFNVIASANGIPLNYQWRKDGTEIPGATNSDYFITGITTADAGDYDVIITGQGNFTCDSTVSAPATLTIGTDGTISQPVNKDTTLCENTALDIISFTLGGSASSVDLTGFLPSGVSLDSLGGDVFTISGTPTQTGTFDYTLTTTGSTCNNPSVSGTIVVEGQGTIILAGGNDSVSLCIDNPLPTITYSIGGNADSASITAGSLPPGISGSYNSTNGLFTISGTPTAAGTYPFTVSASGSLCDNPALSGEITVTDNAILTLTSGSDNQTWCIGTGIDPLTYTIGGSATSAVISLGSLPDGVNLTQTNDTVFTISGTPTETGTFDFTVSTTGSCLNVSDTALITIEPMPFGGVISPADFKVCTEINTGTLTLQSYTGNVLRWESSIDAGFTWTQYNDSTNNTFTYTNLPQFTQFRAVVGNAACGEVYSDTARIVVIPSFTPEITAIGGDVCSGEPITLTANAFILPDTVGIIQGGHFNQANPKGWLIYEDGELMDPFPADHDNEVPGPWAETNSNENNPISFCGQGWLNEKEGKKFALVAGAGVNSWMETPVFNLVGMPAAELSFVHAYMLGPNATARITLSLNGGPFNIVLAEYSGNLMNGMPNVVNDVGIDLSPYLGMTNLRIRFEYDSPDDECSVWAVDDISIPTPAPDIEYEWGPVYEIPGGSGQTVVVVPPTTTEYTLTVYVAGCPGSATEYLVSVVENPEVFTTNTCVGDTATFFQSTSYDGSWSVTGGGAIDNNGLFTADSAGCFEAIYTTTSGDCFGSASFMVFPVAPVPVVDTGCGPFTVTPPPTVEGFDIEYSFDGGSTWGPNVPPTADNCDGYHIHTRYITSALCDSIPIGTVSDCSVSPEFIRVVDQTPPEFTVPNDTTLTKDEDCLYDADISITGDVTDEWDSCSTGLEATYADIVVTGLCADTIFRYWTLIDDCGNEITKIQTIAVADNDHPPTFTVPADFTIYKNADCTFDADTSITGSVTDEADNCAVGLEAIYADTLRYGPCVDTIYRYWTLLDDCGGENTQIQTIIIIDNTKPEFDPEAQDSTMQCSTTDPDLEPLYLAWLANHAGARANDLCDPNLVWTADTALTTWTGVPGNLQREVTFTVTDGCGNSDTTSATFTIIDTLPPTITCPGSVSEIAAADSCSKTPATLGLPTYGDDCSVPELTYERVLPDGTTDNGIGTVNALSFPVGTSTVVYTVTDNAGLTAECSFSVTIVDTVPPTLEINGCQDVTETFGADDCTVNPTTIPDPDYSDNCWPDDSLVLTYVITGDTEDAGSGSVSGLDFNVGVSTVVYTVTDPDGNEASCSFDVTILRADIPYTVITCPDDPAPATVDPGDCDAQVTVDPPTIDENCPTATYTITNNINGDSVLNNYTFPVGTTEVVWTITDNSLNDTTCTVYVVVSGTNDPILTCPTSVTGTMTSDLCEAVPPAIDPPIYSAPCWPNDSLELTYYIVSENAAWDTTGTGFIPSDLEFPVGLNTVTYTVMDPDSNMVSCDFTVTMLQDAIPSTVIDCPTDPVPVVLGPTDCEAILTLTPPTITEVCTTAVYTITNNINAGSTIIDESFDVGITRVVWYIEDNSGNIDSCIVNVDVSGVQLPEITCPSPVTGTMSADDCYAIPPTIGSPTLTAPCWDTDSLDLTFRIINGTWDTTGVGEVNGLNFPVGTNTVWYIVTDPDGNKDSCDFTVTMLQDEIPSTVIDCPTDPAPVVLGPTDCEAILTLTPPTITEVCTTAVYTITNNINAGSTIIDESFDVGITRVVWYIEDNSGNIDSCIVNVDVSGVQLPEITCPSPVTGTMSADDCYAIPPTIGSPTLTAPCWDTDSLDLTFRIINGTWDTTGVGEVNGLPFPVGTNTVWYIVTDPDGNKDSCDFTVTMLQDEIPSTVIDCPTDPAPVTVGANDCEAFVDLDPPTITEVCTTATYTITNDYTGTADADTLYPIGTTTVVWYIEDNSGNIDSCTVYVVVNDLLPTLTCPPSITVPADFNKTYATGVGVGLPTYQDNCDSILTYTILDPFGTLDSIYGDPSDINLLLDTATYQLGVTTITYYFEDGNGNKVNCNFTVEVTGPPVIECPPSDTFYLDDSGCTYPFDPGIPTLISGVQPITWTWTLEDANGNVLTGTSTTPDDGPTPQSIIPNPYDFELGTTTITWTATNISGADTCDHHILVLDTIPPTFTTAPYEDCVDPLHWAVYNEDNPNPVFNHVDPLVEKFPVDYRTMFAGDTILDLTSLEDNCCDSTEMTIHWRIEFSDTPDPVTGDPVSHPDISGIGQPSEYEVGGIPKDIYLWGDGVLFTAVTHSIFYWVEDCNGNSTGEVWEEITITPRPEVKKTDY
ncbi:HYR domain-containing protein [Draconibacterium halophilum]|uniref:HYR domain-containing protein n=1 Tax=Draconibacterium halophilum TaxID=2706887 RepID=A0A6C0RA04_9BACT|nr:HYR domain-containing protein [Draconibacterium halophilum]QIA06263.1 HYR domain-containing protein [Draconibacterium halophilum]